MKTHCNGREPWDFFLVLKRSRTPGRRRRGREWALNTNVNTPTGAGLNPRRKEEEKSCA